MSTLFELPARVVRTSIGLWALVYDGVAVVVSRPGEVLEQLEWRGQRIELTMEREWRRLRRQAPAELKQIADSAVDTAVVPMRWVAREVAATGTQAEVELERQVERVLDRLGIPSRERLEKLTQEIEALSTRIDQELLRIEEAERLGA